MDMPYQPQSPSSFIYERASSIMSEVASDSPWTKVEAPEADDVPIIAEVEILSAYQPATEAAQEETDDAALLPAHRPLTTTPQGPGTEPGDASPMTPALDEPLGPLDPASRWFPHHIIHQVNDICLDITKKVIRDFIQNIRQRNHRRDRDPMIRTIYLEAQVTESLKENVSTVCNIVWAQGHALRDFCPTSELKAVGSMEELMTACDRIVDVSDVADQGDVIITNEDMRRVVHFGCAFCEILERFDEQGRLNEIGSRYFDDWD
ncbi:hypothetical protein NM208_g14584 [Fusarium decemcellulare]|uniref:Uncharacterized protein n=1 Tax=Fusarium decemcellulare TaxID=57161 RepID=A0ACC1RHC3_9HYPO|nr:hypothetical protein NM208_g14584 [Fusarium decemcellulare]